MTPVHVAAAWGRTSVLDLLLKCGADINVKDDVGKTPFDYAITEKHMGVISLLQEYSSTLFTETYNNHYNITLEKIIINNGLVIAEYDTCKPNKYSIDDINQFLKELPKNEINSYVKNWCLENAKVAHENYKLENATKKQPNETFIIGMNNDTEFEFIESENKQCFNEDFITRRTKKNVNVSSYYVNNLDYDYQKKSPWKIYNLNKNPNEISTMDENILLLSKLELSDSSKHSEMILNKNKVQNDINVVRSEQIIELENSEISESDDNLLEKSFIEPSDDSGCGKNESGLSGIQPLSSDLSSFHNSLQPHDECMFIGSIDISSAKNTESSVYMTCNDEKIRTLERNILDSDLMTSDVSDNCLSLITLDKSDIKDKISQTVENTNLVHATGVPCQISACAVPENETFVSVAEEYKYTDQKEGIILIERRYLVTPQITDDNKSVSSIANTVASSLPTTIDYDTDTLRRELTNRGEEPGPITSTTKRVYLKRLMRLQKTPVQNFSSKKLVDRVYSVELEKTLRNSNWTDDLTVYKELDSVLAKQFNQPDPSKKWREGIAKASFTYLLMDPRITQNLPARSEKLKTEETWNIFLSAIFYVGKGKRSRPYSHLYDAVEKWNSGIFKVSNKKLQHILDIWSEGKGVVCLHIFQNVIPVEAYTREAAIISAIKLENLKNAKVGDFYGIAATWSQRQKRQLGVYLLYRAMYIFLHEGERQLRPDDI